MKDFRNEWFFNQHYSKEELYQLWEWVQKGGEHIEVKKHNGKWSGFHPLDTEMKIDIAGQKTKEDCCNWMKRLGFKLHEEKPTKQ